MNVAHERWLIISTKFCIFSEFDELLMIDSGTLLRTIAGPTTNATEIPKDPAKAEIAIAVPCGAFTGRKPCCRD